MAKNVFWLSFGQIGSRTFRAFIIIYAARVLGAETYGVFSYALSLAGFFTVFADIGVNAILTRDAAKEPERAKSYFATSFTIKTVLLLLTVLLVVFVAPSFSKIEAANVLIPFVALLVVFDNLREFCNSFFRAKDKMEWEALVTIITNVAIVISGFVILAFSQTAYAITATYIASAGIGMLAAITLLRREFFGIKRMFDQKLVRPILDAAWPGALAGLLGVFLLNIDIIMLGRIHSATAVGLYAAGQRIVQVLYLPLTIFASALFPTIARISRDNDQARETAVLEKSLVLAGLIAFPLVVGGIILGKPIISLLYGIEYLGGARAFQILLVNLLTIFPTAFLANLLLARNKQKRLLLPTAITALCNVAGNALLIPYFGAAGAAATTIGVQTLYTILLWNLVGNTTVLAVFRRLYKTIIAVIVMSILTILLNIIGTPVLLNIACSGLLYFLVIAVIREPLAKEALGIVSRVFSVKTPEQQ